MAAEGGGGGGVDSQGDFIVCWDERSCLDPTGLLGIVGRPRTAATRLVVARSQQSPHKGYRQWGMRVADLLFKHDLVISSNDPREGAAAKQLRQDLEASTVPIPAPQAGNMMVWAYSREAQDFSKPLPPRLQNAAGDYPPPAPINRIYKLATQTLDVAKQVKLVYDIAQCVLLSEVPAVAAACIIEAGIKYGLSKLAENALKWVAKEVGKLSTNGYEALQDRVENWKKKHDKNDDPPTPIGAQAELPGEAKMTIPTPLDTPIPLTSAQNCKSCAGDGDFEEEIESGERMYQYTRSDDASFGAGGLLRGSPEVGINPIGRAPGRSYGSQGQVYRLRNQGIYVEGSPRPAGLQTWEEWPVVPYIQQRMLRLA